MIDVYKKAYQGYSVKEAGPLSIFAKGLARTGLANFVTNTGSRTITPKLIRNMSFADKRALLASLKRNSAQLSTGLKDHQKYLNSAGYGGMANQLGELRHIGNLANRYYHGAPRHRRGIASTLYKYTNNGIAGRPRPQYTPRPQQAPTPPAPTPQTPTPPAPTPQTPTPQAPTGDDKITIPGAIFGAGMPLGLGVYAGYASDPYHQKKNL